MSRQQQLKRAIRFVMRQRMVWFVLRRRSNAGKSARLMARQLRWHQRRLAAKWGGGVTAVVAVATAGPLGGVVGSSVAGLAAGVPVAVWVARRPTGAQRWQQGAEAEERTGQLLRALERQGWLVRHDLGIRGSKANLDHLVVHPSGTFAVYIDTKAWHARGAIIRWDLKRKSMMYGRFDKMADLRTVEWEASKAQEVLDVAVMSIMCIDGGTVKGSIVHNNHATPGPDGFLQIDDSYVVESERLIETLESIQGGPENPRALRQLARAVAHGLPQK